MEATLKLSFIARIQIMGILNEKAKGKPYDPEYKIATDLYEKIFVTDEQQEALAKKLENGTSYLTPEAIRSVPALEVKLDYKELAKLNKLLSEHECRPGDRMLWFAGVMEQLEALSKPALEPEQIRAQRLEMRKR
jgi:hypothetical protein